MSVVGGKKFRPPIHPGSRASLTRPAQGPQEAGAERELGGHPDGPLGFTDKGPETLKGGNTELTAIVVKLGMELVSWDGSWFQNQPNRAVNSCPGTVQPCELGSGMCPSSVPIPSSPQCCS